MPRSQLSGTLCRRRIAGENYGTIEKCYNVGIIHANGDEQASAGGITGLTLGCSIKTVLTPAMFKPRPKMGSGRRYCWRF